MVERRSDHQAKRRSPLTNLTDQLDTAIVGVASAVSLRELPFLTMVNVRVRPGSLAAGRIAGVLGTTMPSCCGETGTAGRYTVLWLGPDEWLVVSDSPTNAVIREMRAALAGDHGVVVDVSANRTTLELWGPAARSVLQKGCRIDLHPLVFGLECAVSTRVSLVPVVLWHVDDMPTYRLLPPASCADYLARWLMDAMTEYTVVH